MLRIFIGLRNGRRNASKVVFYKLKKKEGRARWQLRKMFE
jgi:hypothetical protein